MAKKRKTREQKEKAQSRKLQQIDHYHVASPTYSVENIVLKEKNDLPSGKKIESSYDKDQKYLRHDIFAISAASGIVIAFDVLLFVLLTSGVLKLNFLGY